MLTQNSLFKIFVVVVCFFEHQVHSAAEHLELGALAEELRGKIGAFHEIAGARERLEASTAAVQKQVFELTRGFCQLLGWNNYVPKKAGSAETDWVDYNKCLSLIKIVQSLPMVAEDRALFCASNAKIRLKKLAHLVAQGGFDAFEKEEKLRKIYDLFMQSKGIRNRKQCRLEIAGLILDWKFSPTGNLAEDYEIAEKMLPYHKPSLAIAGALSAGAGSPGGGGLPHGNSAELREEECRLIPLLMKKKQALVAAAPAVADAPHVLGIEVVEMDCGPIVLDAAAVVLDGASAAIEVAQIVPAVGIQGLEMETALAAMDDVPASEEVYLLAAAEVEDSDDDFALLKPKRNKRKIVWGCPR